MKIEFIEGENEDSYWLLGLNLCSARDTKQSIQTLYNYYLKNLTELKDVHHAFGRILMYKGLYYKAEKWLQTGNHYEDLAEIAIRQNQCERANQYLEHLPEDSDDGNLLRAYVNLLISIDNIAKGRTLLMKVCSEATDRIVRARANIALGFINLIVTQQIDQALDYFTVGSQTLCKYLPEIHPDIAKSYIGIGYTHFVRHDINEAEKYFQMAFKIQKQSLSYKHPDLAKTRNGLAHCLSLQKQTIKQAFKEFEYAFNILMQTFPREYKIHPEILLTKNDMEKLRKGKELRARNTLLDYI
jgi:tetratricopeptide (TPR) repeat protein